MRCKALPSSAPWLLLISCSFGCEVLTDVDAQCEQNAHCEHRFGPGYVCGGDGVCSAPGTASGAVRGALAARWVCLERPAKPIVVVDPTRAVRTRMEIFDQANGHPLQGIRVRACLRADASCTQPTADGLTSDDDGMIDFDVPYGFDGHFELSGSGMLPLILSDIPLVKDSSVSAPMLTPKALAAKAALGGDRFDDTRGFVLLSLFDCDGKPADGVRLDAPGSPDNAAFYFDGSLPTRELHSTIVNPFGRPAQPLAMAGFINVMPGSVTFRGTLSDSGRQMGFVTLQVRAGTMTVARFQAGYE